MASLPIHLLINGINYLLIYLHFSISSSILSFVIYLYLPSSTLSPPASPHSHITTRLQATITSRQATETTPKKLVKMRCCRGEGEAKEEEEEAFGPKPERDETENEAEKLEEEETL